MDIREAIESAKNVVIKTWGLIGGDVRLEEIDSDDVNWLVTVSFSDNNYNPFGAIQPKRTYKIVKINRAAGTVESIKMRE